MAKNISGKTGATGAAGAVSGVGLAPLIIWILGQFGIEMDAATAAVAGGLISTVVSTLIAYFVPAKTGKYVDTEPWELELPDEKPAAIEQAGINDEPDIVDPEEFDLAEVV